MKGLFNRKKLITSALASLAGLTGLLSSPLTANALLVIDPFNGGSGLVVLGNGSTPVTGNYCDNVAAGAPCSGFANGGGVLGGQREVRMITDPTTSITTGIASQTIAGGGGFFRFSSDNDGFGQLQTARLRWDGSTISTGATPDAAGFGVTDLTLAAQDRLRVVVLSQNDIGGNTAPFNTPDSTLTFTLWEGAISSSSSVVLPNGSTGPIDYDFLFPTFTGINLTQITAIDLTISIWSDDFSPNLIRLNTVQVGVPFEFSPALGLVSLGALFGLSRLRNRRKSSASPDLAASKPEINSFVS